MKLQYSTGRKAITRSFFIPIGEWNALKAKSLDFNQNEIPEWHKAIIAERVEAYENGSEEVFDSEEALKEIEKDLAKGRHVRNKILLTCKISSQNINFAA